MTNPTRTLEDVALLSIQLFDDCQHFRDVAGDLCEDGSGVITFEVDGKRYEVTVRHISPEREAEVYGA